MQECGSLVPMIVNWPSMIKKPGVSNSLIDAADFIPTFAELAGAPLPTNNVLDGVSFAYQLKGGKGTALCLFDDAARLSRGKACAGY